MDKALFRSRNLLIPLALLAIAASSPANAVISDMARWKQKASQVTITRDNWEFPHVRGRSDADTVFGRLCQSKCTVR